VTIGALAPNPFDPASAPPDDELRVPFVVTTNDSATSTSVFVRQSGAIVDTLGTVADAGSFELPWDGQLGTNQDAASGDYEILAESQDLAGNAASAARSFTLDRDAPEIAVPDTVQTTSFPAEIRGVAEDDDLVAGVFARFLPDSTYASADTVSAPGDSVEFVVLVQDASPVPGRRTVEILVEDALGHPATASVVVAYDAVLPQPLSTVLVGGSPPYHEEDQVVIRTTWNSDSLDIDANFAALDSRWISGAEDVVNEGGGSYLVSYTISRTTDRSSGIKTVPIIGRYGFLSAADSAFVEFAGRTTGTEILVNRNRIDPSRGESVTIQAPEIGDAIEVEIYNLAGARVRTLEGTGQVFWDGRTEDGASAASGTYFLRCTAGSVEDVRRIVVRRGG
jgi:flagellar hook assembly protein FlgD